MLQDVHNLLVIQRYAGAWIGRKGWLRGLRESALRQFSNLKYVPDVRDVPTKSHQPWRGGRQPALDRNLRCLATARASGLLLLGRALLRDQGSLRGSSRRCHAITVSTDVPWAAIRAPTL